jgi:branched-chain amino acid transport system substrate-binding protein
MTLINAGRATDAINEQGFRYVVTVWTPLSQYHWTTLNAIKQIEPSARIALLFADDEFNRYSYRGVVSKARELGLQIVYEKLFPLDTKDFTPYLTELAASKADVLVAGAYLAGGQVLIKQIADLGINFKLISITHALCLLDFYKALGTLAEGIVCPSQWEPGASYTPELARSKGIEWFDPTTEEFLKLFREVTDGKLEPGYWGGAGAVGVLALVKAIEIAQSLDQDAVRAAFNRIHIMTFWGEFKIDPETGKQIAHEMVLAQWQKGKFVVVWPPSVAQAKLTTQYQPGMRSARGKRQAINLQYPISI